MFSFASGKWFMKKKAVIIPIFIPEMACGHQCVYCNQRKITGVSQAPSPEEVAEFIQERLLQISLETQQLQIAFFGGNFTGIPLDEQSAYLDVAQYFIDNERVDSIRISTRPDYISEDALQFLKKYSVRNIELGTQSMCDDVLRQAGRGHTIEDTIKAAALIKQHDFILGLQMMTGLPGDTAEKTLYTANEIVRLGATETRIYPLLVFRETALFDMYQSGMYSPLTIQETIERLVPVVRLFEDAKVKILRIGLHPSEDLLGGEMVAGPWHPAIRQMIYSQVWNSIIKENISNSQQLIFKVSTEQFPNAIGFRKINSNEFANIQFMADKSITGMNYEIDHC